MPSQGSPEPPSQAMSLSRVSGGASVHTALPPSPHPFRHPAPAHPTLLWYLSGGTGAPPSSGRALQRMTRERLDAEQARLSQRQQQQQQQQHRAAAADGASSTLWFLTGGIGPPPSSSAALLRMARQRNEAASSSSSRGRHGAERRRRRADEQEQEQRGGGGSADPGAGFGFDGNVFNRGRGDEKDKKKDKKKKGVKRGE
ncbi:hypothetical protein AAE478_002433 [Parahypoxylon ruwenzoriense]